MNYRNTAIKYKVTYFLTGIFWTRRLRRIKLLTQVWFVLFTNFIKSKQFCYFIRRNMSSGHTFLPKRTGDRIACCLMVITLVIVVNFELRTVLPIYHEPYSTWWLIHTVCAFFAAFNVFSNLFFMMATDTTSGSASLPAVLKPGWTYCPFCQLNSPPRSYHCHVCDTCILKRDHHCVFGGTCVGYKNYRYYLMMVVYLWLGALYANIYHFEYIHSIAGGFGLVTFFTMFMPFIMLICGYSTGYQFYVLFLAGISVLSLFLFSCLLYLQIKLILNGQVTYENKRGKREYDLGYIDNIKDVMGTQWYMAWISPFLPSSMPGDGVNFRRGDIFYDIKKM